TLDNLMANTAKVAGKKRESLEASGELVKVSRSLVRLDTNVDLKMDWDNWKIQPMDTARMLALCKEWGFNSLANQIRALDGDVALAAPAAPAQSELFSGEELFPFGANAPAETAEPAGVTRWGPACHPIHQPAALD